MRTLADLCGSGEEEGVGVFYLLLPQSSLHSTCFTHMIKKYKMSHFSPYIMTQGKGNYPTNKLAKLRRCASQVHFEKYSSSNVKVNDGLLFGANEELTHSEGVIVIEDTHRKVRPHWWDRPRASKPILLKITWTRCIRGILPWVHWFLNLPSTMLNVLNLF